MALGFRYDKVRERSSVAPPTPGTIVGGKYRILRPLGEGGMGAVFEAENVLTGKHAAIKWVHPRVRDVKHASKRLIQEARAAARVRHPNVVDIYDVVFEDDSLFLVMELVLGEQLSQYLARAQMRVHELIALLLPAMKGVAAAHAAGVIHRDIKPENILLARGEHNGAVVPKVIDFGISRIFESADSRLTSSGITMGTPRYVCFEQLRGARDVDQRADVYAFGVILYETIVGRPPYDAASFSEQAISFVTTSPPAPRVVWSDVPAALDAIVMAAIARERGERLTSMDEFVRALEPFTLLENFGEVPLRAHALRASSSEQTSPGDPAPATAPQESTPPLLVARGIGGIDRGDARPTPRLPNAWYTTLRIARGPVAAWSTAAAALLAAVTLHWASSEHEELTRPLAAANPAQASSEPSITRAEQPAPAVVAPRSLAHEGRAESVAAASPEPSAAVPVPLASVSPPPAHGRSPLAHPRARFDASAPPRAKAPPDWRAKSARASPLAADGGASSTDVSTGVPNANANESSDRRAETLHRAARMFRQQF